MIILSFEKSNYIFIDSIVMIFHLSTINIKFVKIFFLKVFLRRNVVEGEFLHKWNWMQFFLCKLSLSYHCASFYQAHFTSSNQFIIHIFQVRMEALLFSNDRQNV